MTRNLKKWLRPVLFTLGGALAGYLYYRLVGCASGSCAITSNPWISSGYGAVIGWLLSIVFAKDCCRKSSNETP